VAFFRGRFWFFFNRPAFFSFFAVFFGAFFTLLLIWVYVFVGFLFFFAYQSTSKLLVFLSRRIDMSFAWSGFHGFAFFFFFFFLLGLALLGILWRLAAFSFSYISLFPRRCWLSCSLGLCRLRGHPRACFLFFVFSLWLAGGLFFFFFAWFSGMRDGQHGGLPCVCAGACAVRLPVFFFCFRFGLVWICYHLLVFSIAVSLLWPCCLLLAAAFFPCLGFLFSLFVVVCVCHKGRDFRWCSLLSPRLELSALSLPVTFLVGALDRRFFFFRFLGFFFLCSFAVY